MRYKISVGYLLFAYAMKITLLYHKLLCQEKACMVVLVFGHENKDHLIATLSGLITDRFYIIMPSKYYPFLYNS
jgi:hypothetical protein